MLYVGGEFGVHWSFGFPIALMSSDEVELRCCFESILLRRLEDGTRSPKRFAGFVMREAGLVEDECGISWTSQPHYVHLLDQSARKASGTV